MQERTKPGSSAGVSRRAFLGAGVGGGAAILAGGWSSLAHATPRSGHHGEHAPWLEATIPQLQRLMRTGRLTSRELTLGYLERIRSLNPILGAVIETNPNAVALAVHLDNERRKGRVRGPLHGIPILLKDNVATRDHMETTAGSLALVRSRVPADAVVADRLRRAGAVILGKANLSEWANFRGFSPFMDGMYLNGWSARGGFTRNPYLLGWDTSGSSSGSAVAAAANLCAAAVGTETDGSIVSPSGNNLVVGLKPSLGLVSQDGIIPIAHSQDTAGPMARTVTDVAVLLGALQSPFGDVRGRPLPRDYTAFLHPGALAGARIGVDPHMFYDYTDPIQATVAWQAVEAMEALGATIVQPVDIGDPLATFYDAEFFVLLHEFKIDVARYLAGLRHTSMRSLADLIAFNLAHCPEEMKYFGQEIFEISETTSGDPTDPAYLAARATCLEFARDKGLQAAIDTHSLDAIVIPSAGWASSHAAVAGYPNLSLPVGFDSMQRPVGLCLIGGFLQEPKLISLAFALEQEIEARRPPELLGTPPVWPDAGICAVLDTTGLAARSIGTRVRSQGPGERGGPRF
jgi:amidase